MSFDKFQNMIRQQASLVQNSVNSTQLGSVVDYDPVNYLVIVELYPSESDGTQALQTGWIPLFTQWSGNGWGMFAPPSPGDIIEVHYQEGSLQNAYAGLRTFNYNQIPNTPPAPTGGVPSGEFWLIHKSGAFIKITNDTNISILSPLAINLTAPTINLAGAVNMGNLMAALTPLLNGAAATAYNGHTHSNSGGVTTVPSILMDASMETSNTKGN